MKYRTTFTVAAGVSSYWMADDYTSPEGADELVTPGALPTEAQMEAKWPAYAAARLDRVRDGLKAEVDAKAEALRLTLITPGSGQAMEYQEAYGEAVRIEAWLAANPGQPVDPAPYPMLAASIGSSRDPGPGAGAGLPTVDVAGEARASLAAYDAYQRAGAAIRGVRLKGKAAIGAAASIEAAQAAFAAIVWPVFG